MNSLQIDELNLPITTPITALFAHYSSKPWSILLDSANSQHQDGRFDLIVSSPIATVIQNKTLTIEHCLTGKTEQCTEEVIKSIKQLMTQYFPTQTSHQFHPDIPFIGGVLGYFGYDFSRHCEPAISTRFENDYSLPKMALGLYSWCILKDNHLNQWRLISHSHLPCPSKDEIEALGSKPTPKTSFNLSTTWRKNTSQDQYSQQLAKIKHYLEAGDCYQVNFAQRFDAEFTGDPWQAYQVLTEHNHAPFSSFIRIDNQHAILSVSPERFIKLKNNQAESKPIKGTRPRSSNEHEDQRQKEALQASEKDLAENLMIVDLLRNDMSKHSVPHSVNTSNLFEIQSFPSVHHLVSTVTSQLKPQSHPLDLFFGAFPGGSITGAPKIRAMEIIDELEVQGRSIYCGSIGYLSIDGSMDSNICIRTLLCENSTVYCWAGGGIVLDSTSDEEYAETFHKVSKILPVLEKY
jgi:para-aminobenzoate synthetase component 1